MYNQGRSLIEIVMIVAIIAVILTVVIVPLSKFRKQQALQNTTNAIVSILNEARTKTMASYNNTTYGVHFTSSNITLFTGTTYSSGATDNEVYTYESPTSVTYNLGVSGSGSGTDIYFSRLKGTPSQYGTITTSISGGGTYTITVSSIGSIIRN
jgi:Tfp pilus assembly protein FimT